MIELLYLPQLLSLVICIIKYLDTESKTCKICRTYLGDHGDSTLLGLFLRHLIHVHREYYYRVLLKVKLLSKEEYEKLVRRIVREKLYRELLERNLNSLYTRLREELAYVNYL